MLIVCDSLPVVHAGCYVYQSGRIFKENSLLQAKPVVICEIHDKQSLKKIFLATRRLNFLN